MERYVHPRNSIFNKYTNHPKGHKFEGLILVEEFNRRFRSKGGLITVYYVLRNYFPDAELFTAWSYVHGKE